MKRPQRLSTIQERVLRDQVITTDQPGSVVRDFDMLLDVLGQGGVETAGKYHLLPLRLIGDLDRRLSRPLELELKRPQIRSHPYLQALNLLLRASGLLRVKLAGAKSRLELDPAMKMQWDQLNPTERYFNLLEAAFRFGRSEMVGERGQAWGGLLRPCLTSWESTPKNGHKFDLDKPQTIFLLGVFKNWYLLALMDLFGLMAVEHPPKPVATWYPASLRHVPFGDAVMTLLITKHFDLLHETLEYDEVDEEEDEEEDGGALRLPKFGAWQPHFQPFFPEWRRNLEFPRRELREGMFIFRVSLDKVWRLIAMPSDATVEELADWILDSVKFDNDHLYEFAYLDSFGVECSIHHPELQDRPWADEVAIGELPLEPGQSMTFLFDFGDDWSFDVKLERIEPRRARKHPRILERHGEPPPQYPGQDE